MSEMTLTHSGHACKAYALLLLSTLFAAWACSDAAGESDRKHIPGGHSFVAPEGWLTRKGVEMEGWVFALTYPGVKPGLAPAIIVTAKERGETTLDSLMETFKNSPPPGVQVLQVEKFQPRPDLPALRAVLIRPEYNFNSEFVFIETTSSFIMITANATNDAPGGIWEKVITARDKLVQSLRLAK